jgi:hypothetical protein
MYCLLAINSLQVKLKQNHPSLHSFFSLTFHFHFHSIIIIILYIFSPPSTTVLFYNSTSRFSLFLSNGNSFRFCYFNWFLFSISCSSHYNKLYLLDFSSRFVLQIHSLQSFITLVTTILMFQKMLIRSYALWLLSFNYFTTNV